MFSVKVFLLALLVLGIACKYGKSPQYSFNGFSSSSGTPLLMYLSGDSDRLGLFSSYTTSYNTQTIFNLDGGSRQCSNSTTITMIPLGFPAQTNLLYFDVLYGSIIKMASACGSPITIANITNNNTVYGIGSTEKESFLALGFSNRITQYSIGSGGVSKTYNLNSGQSVAFLEYSQQRDYLWVGVQYGSSAKLVAFETSSGSRKNDIPIDLSMGFVKGNNDGDAFVGYASNVFYNIDKSGNKKTILNYNPYYEMFLGVCTYDDVLLTLKLSTSSVYTLFAYDTEDGSEIQNIELGFTPVQFTNSKQIINCNNKYLTFVDRYGNFQVFEYSHAFPVWAIILIVVGGLLIIGGAVGFFIYRKRKLQRMNGGYQQFGSENRV